jgi:parallel beta-helix repeat protein
MRKSDYSANSDRREIIVAASLITVLSIAAFSTYNFWVPPLGPPPPVGIAIDGDDDFSYTALLEGWPGDGSPENPFIINGLDIDNTALSDQQMYSPGTTHCISISNTRVSFTISNCNLTGAHGYTPSSTMGAGISLVNVTNGELVNNICNNNLNGIILKDSDSNTLVNNTCNYNGGANIWLIGSTYNTIDYNTCNSTHDGICFIDSNFNTVTNNICNNNRLGISLYGSHHNTVANNICNNNYEGERGCGISLSESDFGGSNHNTVVNNTCNSNDIGIFLGRAYPNLADSHSNTVANNTCNSNIWGIYLFGGSFSTVENNTCNSNDIGIWLSHSDYNTVANNTCLNNTEHDICLDYSYYNTVVNNTTDK